MLYLFIAPLKLADIFHRLYPLFAEKCVYFSNSTSTGSVSGSVTKQDVRFDITIGNNYIEARKICRAV